MSVNTCLETVVGLSSNDCACFETDRPEGYNTSLSGYYLDDPEYGFPLQIPQNLQQCSTTDLWAVMERARTYGITAFVTELGAALLSGPFNKKVEPFNDWICEPSHSFNLTNASTWAGSKFCPKIFRGTTGKVYKVELYVSGRSGDTIALNFYNEAGLTSGVASGTVNVVMSGNKGVATLTSAHLHDFMDDYSQRSPLWILYQPGAGYPRNNTIKCNCNKTPKWDKYFAISGVTGATLTDIRDLTLKENSDCLLNSPSSYAYGIRINMGASCGADWLCQNFDFENNEWARIMAECIALYGIKALAGIILQEPGPNKYTQITREEVAFHRDRVATLLGQRMPWLAQNVPSTATDCFTCNDKIKVEPLMV